MTIQVRFVGQSKDGGRSHFGYHAQWRLDKENRDIKEACESVKELNKRQGYYSGEFYTWIQTYAREEQDGEKKSLLVDYLGSSSPELVQL